MCNNTSRALLLAASLSSTLSLTAFAETNSKLETMVVSASRIEMPLRKAGVSISVLTSEDIKAYGNISVADILRSLPAINVSNNGGLGKATSLRIRGEDGYRTKFLIDGVDVSDPTGTQVQAQIQHILSSQVERIEVLRGPQGMMYGADAGGVVNIITKNGKDGVQGNISAEYGRYNTKQLSGNVSGKLQNLDYSLTISDLSSDGFNTKTTDDTSKDNDGYNNTTIGASIGYQLTNNFRLQAIVRDIDGESEFDDCSGSNNCEEIFEQTNYKIDAIYNLLSFEHKISYALTEIDKENFADGTYWYGYKGEKEQIQYAANYTLSNANQIVFGIDLQEELDNSYSTRERDQLGLYAEWQGSIDNNFFYTVGIRNDDNDDFGHYTSYRATTAYLLTLSEGNEVKFKGSYGTGFRAPSLSEIAYNISQSGPTLEQETSKGYDLGIELHTNNGLFIEAIYFHQEIEDNISWGVSNYVQDKGISKSDGVEINSELPIDDNFSILANYTYNDTENSSGLQRIRRPENTINIGLRFATNDNRLKVNLNWRSVEDAQGIGQVSLDDYEVLDINAWYALSDKLEIYTRAENILDEKYEEAIGYNTTAAAVYGGLRYQF